MKTLRILLTAALALHSVAALAQWQWLDRDGRKVFSDRPPPIDIPEKNILKRPGRAPQPATTPATTPDAAEGPAAAASASAAPAPKKSELDAKLEEKKKQADQAEAAKRKAEEDRAAAARADNCQRARNAKTALDSGIRMSTTNAKGEREIMDEAARAAESRRIQATIASDCK